MATQADLLDAFEVHSPGEIEGVLRAGVSPVDLIKGKRPVDCLIEGYLRSPRFAGCLRMMLAAGADVGDPLLQALLLDDASALPASHPLSLLTAFTSCRGVSPLHVCAEFNSVECARRLIASGADVNAPALVEEQGIGGQTPIFHAVNSIHNYCRPMMELLVDAGASLDVRVPMLLWGETMPWETLVFDVTPVSYAQCGLYRQFHRDEQAVYSNIAYLMRAKTGAVPPERNVPNQYLVR